mmetsp:Transcript_15913/g.27106  ORF Transcript_15913/g.27106 Transcript_15913/m.27106 type:complete len:229 (-) Transcript_15913:78-764(-)
MHKSFKSNELTFEKIAPHFHLPISTAASKLGVCPTLLKNICREIGIHRWPHRQIQSLTNMTEKLEATLPSLHGEDKKKLTPVIEELKKKKALILEDPRIHNEPLHQQRKEFRSLYKKFAEKKVTPSVNKSTTPTSAFDNTSFSTPQPKITWEWPVPPGRQSAPPSTAPYPPNQHRQFIQSRTLGSWSHNFNKQHPEKPSFNFSSHHQHLSVMEPKVYLNTEPFIPYSL